MMLRRLCSKCKRQKAEVVMISVKLNGEVDHETLSDNTGRLKLLSAVTQKVPLAG